MKKNKFIFYSIIICLIIFVLICFFSKVDYKNKRIGNNNNIKYENIKDYFLSISSYRAIVEVTVNSNKNTNKYLLEQTYSLNKSTQKGIEPPEIKDIEIIRNNNNLEVKSGRFNLSKIYENYNYLFEDSISLEGFIKDYLNEKNKCREENNELEDIVEIELKDYNKFIKYKRIYFDKKSKLPNKIEVLDVNRNIRIYIKYNEIEIN